MLNVEQMVVIGATAVLCALLYALFRYSKVGIAMQAASQNQLAAYYMGIPVKRLNGLVWGARGGGRGGRRPAAGADHLRARQHGLHRPEGLSGRGGRRLRQPAGRASSAGWSSASSRRSRASTCPKASRTSRAYVVVLVMLVVKPNGLFGEKLRKKV